MSNDRLLREQHKHLISTINKLSVFDYLYRYRWLFKFLLAIVIAFLFISEQEALIKSGISFF